MLTAILSKLPAAQKTLLSNAIHQGQLVPVADLKLETWPTISFVLQGDAGDVKLDVPVASTVVWRLAGRLVQWRLAELYKRVQHRTRAFEHLAAGEEAVLRIALQLFIRGR
jgi:hypothetical protein